jgi:hypothetical protein
MFNFALFNSLYWMNRSCGTIDLGSDPDCDAIPKGGTRARVIVINFDDIETFAEDADGRITSITLVAGAGSYLFTGFRNDVKKSDDVANPGVGLNQFLHKTGWVIYERTQEQKNNVENLARGRFVVIAENKGRDDDAVEVIGIDVGVEIVAGPIRNAHENGGFFMLNFSTPEGEYEGKLPRSLGTDYDDAQTIIDALLAES